MKVKVVTPQCIARPRSTVMSKMRATPSKNRTTCACMTAVIAVITITEVICEDKIENKCFNVAKFVDATNTVDQQEIIIGEPSCEQITLTLDTQACRQQHHAVVAHAVPVAHHAVHHSAHHAVHHG